MAHLYQVVRYNVELRRQLGRGAYGTVYKAKDNKGTIVAAKEIDKDPSSRGSLQELENSVKHKQLNHKNIVRILDIYKDDTQMWIFQEFCNGGDLNNYARTHFQEFSGGKLMIMQQIAEGLTFLHDLRIAHRDMKPGNILIHRQTGEQPITVKLTDFGLAKFHPLDARSSTMSSNVGTRLYKAPELWNRNEDGGITYHKSVDVYTMGLTFLAMLQAR